MPSDNAMKLAKAMIQQVDQWCLDDKEPEDNDAERLATLIDEHVKGLKEQLDFYWDMHERAVEIGQTSGRKVVDWVLERHKADSAALEGWQPKPVKE